jgi:hypothetical protein
MNGASQVVYIDYPLVNVYSLLLKMAMEIVDLHIKKRDFP